MEEKKELNKILLGDENNNPQSGAKKTILLIVIAIIIILILLVVFWKITRPEPKVEPMTTDNSIQKLDQIQGDNFDDVPMDDMNKSQDSDTKLDKFDKILQDIQDKQKTSTQENEQKPEPTMNEPMEAPTPPNPPKEKDVAPIKPALDKPIAPKAQTKPAASKESKPVVKKELKETKKPAVSKPASQKATPTKTADTKNGSNVTPGFYLQVGAFAKTPNQAFLNKIKKHSYRTQASFVNGELVTKYLIGPYGSREQASKDVETITKEITKPVYVQVK